MMDDHEIIKYTITKIEIDELLKLDTYEEFIKATEDKMEQCSNYVSALMLFNYLTNMKGEE